MTDQRLVTPAPAPLEAYAKEFDGLFSKLNQRHSFRRYLEGLLLPRERHKSLTGLANTEPVVGAQHRQAQALQWFLSESNWSERAVEARRRQLLRSDPLTAPTAEGVLASDEHGDRKDGDHTAHVGRQYLANLGKIDHGVVQVEQLVGRGAGVLARRRRALHACPSLGQGRAGSRLPHQTETGRRTGTARARSRVQLSGGGS